MARRRIFIMGTFSLTRPTIKPGPARAFDPRSAGESPVLGWSVAKKATAGQDVLTEDHSDALSRRAR